MRFHATVAAAAGGRLLVRLAPATLVAIGALTWAHHLSVSERVGTETVTATAAHSVATHATAARVGYDPRPTATDSQQALTAAFSRPVAAGGSTGGSPGGAHDGAFDPAHPAAGGVLDASVADDVGRAVGGSARLGPLHVDPMPAGVSLASPTDTASLIARSGVAAPAGQSEDAAAGAAPAPSEASSAASDGPATAASVPPGTPNTTGLTQHVAPSCSGTGTDGNRVQAMYVHEASASDRYSSVLSILRNEVANVDDVFAVSSRKTGGELRVRWVHNASCVPVILDVTVPDGALDTFNATITALKALGYKSPSRKYVMFTDANAYCGIGTLYPSDSAFANPNDGSYASYSRIDVNCWSTGQSVAAHELTHNLGGVQRSAPHSTENGHCYDESDLMCYSDAAGVTMQQVCATSQGDLLDCNNDDYFSARPAAGSYLATHWNTARSSFLDDVSAAPVAPSVTVTASRSAAETGDRVSFTASTSGTVTWAWSVSDADCALTGTTTPTAVLTCPAAVSGPVSVTATATDTASHLSGSDTASVVLTTASAPTAALDLPAGAAVDAAFAVGAAVTGKAPFGYTWTVDGPCSLSSATAARPSVTCTDTGDAVLSVEVRQNDGQTVLAGPGTVPVTVDGPPPAATSWSSITRATKVPVRLVATLRDAASGTPLAGQPVTLQVRWRGSDTWVTSVGGLTTDASGSVAAEPALTRAGTFRFAYAGAAGHLASTSPTLYVKVPTKLSLTLKPDRHQVVGRLTTLSGRAVASARVRLERRTSDGAWTLVTRAITGAKGYAKVTVDPRRATYYRWTFAGEIVHRNALSARVLFRT